MLAEAALDSGRVRSPQTFFQAANQYDTTFNWAYLDDRNVAYFSSGLLPRRAAGVNPSLPTLGDGRHDWRGFLSLAQHPHAANPRTGQAAGLVDAWVRRGASRLDRNLDGSVDDPGAAVLDASFDGLATAVLHPVLGGLADDGGLFTTLQRRDEAPYRSGGNG